MPDPVRLTTRFLRGPASWAFQYVPTGRDPMRAIRESVAAGVVHGMTHGEKLGPLDGADNHMIVSVYSTPIGQLGGRTTYHTQPGIEHERALLICTTDRLARLPEDVGSRWEDQPDGDPSILRFFLVAESQVLATIAEEWLYPAGAWKAEVIYAVLPDELFEVG